MYERLWIQSPKGFGYKANLKCHTFGEMSHTKREIMVPTIGYLYINLNYFFLNFPFVNCTDMMVTFIHKVSRKELMNVSRILLSRRRKGGKNNPADTISIISSGFHF